MVDPSRIRHRIEKIEIDQPRYLMQDGLHIDFIVKGDTRWFIDFSFEHRSMRVYGNIRHTFPPKKLCNFLISIVPPDIIAHCTAKAITYRPIPDSDGDPF